MLPKNLSIGIMLLPAVINVIFMYCIKYLYIYIYLPRYTI